MNDELPRVCVLVCHNHSDVRDVRVHSRRTKPFLLEKVRESEQVLDWLMC